MHLKQLQYTLEVAKCKSFSKAAKKLYVSQPSLSTSISSFEEELGLTIFLRTTSGVVLTQEGEQVLAQIEEVLTSVDRLAAMGKQGFVKYNTTLAAIPSACNGMVINLLGEVAQSNPEITLNILELRPQKVLQSLINGVTDIVIGSYTEETKKYIFKETQKNNLPPLITVALYRLALSVAEAFSSVFGIKELSELFKAAGWVMSIIMAVIVCFLLLNTISAVIMLAIGSGIA